ncbi:MAG: formamidopyrimidine-DNA glycosylase, partial [Gemmatimonadetes bacterium]|nr:formamidopyrimidine-DNA glycosylase [Gemmatimonadota bacterium]
MPELPEISAYLRAFEDRIVGRALQRVRLRSPSFLRTFDPPLSSVEGRVVGGVRRLGKRVVWALEGDLFVVVHLMVTGRFHRRAPGVALPKKHAHAAFDFDDATYLVTERGKQKKASLHVVAGEAGLADHDRGGVEPLTATLEEFVAAVTSENRTLKRALTDPRILSGIGNAHSDEILLKARLSPVMLTSRLTDEEMDRLHEATTSSLAWWSELLREEWGDRFPTKVKAFHP